MQCTVFNNPSFKCCLTHDLIYNFQEITRKELNMRVVKGLEHYLWSNAGWYGQMFSIFIVTLRNCDMLWYLFNIKNLVIFVFS